MLLRKTLPSFLLSAGLTVLLAACSPTATPVATQPAEPTQTLPTAAPTEVPNKSLVVCVGAEPDSLYMYASSSRTTWSILEAVYDGPFDQVNYQAQPVIMESVPTVAGGDVAVKPVEVKLGDAVVDASGVLTSLTAGLEVYPAGCNSSQCVVKWDGSSTLQMDQLTATFKFKSGLLWSDGQPLKASDSVYSFRIASDAATPVNKKVIDRTADYRAVDDTTLTWTGVPGYWPQSFDTVFFSPLPEHALGELSAADLLTADAAVKSPLGWGPYQIDEWVSGDHITLSKNPNYFRASEGLPKFDKLVYRFISEQGDANLVALLTGECDVIDSSTLLDDQLETIVELSNNNSLTAYFAQGPEWEHLDFGVTPAALDGDATSAERPDYFGDARTRQALAACVDTDAIYESVMHNRSAVPASYYPMNHPLYNADLKSVAFDTDAGAALLEEIGWKDEDGDPATPRVARGVANVPDGTPFSVSLLTTQAAVRQEVAAIVSSSLAKCGVQVKVETMTPDQLYAAGPDGPLFGRNFDLALFAWQSSSVSPYFLYTTSQIPNAANNYIGANITGYSNTDYDALCKAAQQPGLDDAARKQAEAAVQAKFAADLPVVPLYYQLQTAVTRTDLCGLTLDSSARSALRDLEQFDIDGCPAK